MGATLDMGATLYGEPGIASMIRWDLLSHQHRSSRVNAYVNTLNAERAQMLKASHSVIEVSAGWKRERIVVIVLS